MSGIGLLFDSAIDYERTHQIALYTLLKQSRLGSLLLQGKTVSEIQWEPEGQLFDLGLKSTQNTYTYIELKMWSRLSENQQNRQTKYLKENNAKGIYLLLGTSWFEFTHEDVEGFSDHKPSKIGYPELIALLNQVIASGKESPDVLELALSYRISLEKQHRKLAEAYKDNPGGLLFWYSMYGQIRSNLKVTKADVYHVNNPGGEVYILNDRNSWHRDFCNGIAIKLYLELVNGTLCIKFWADTESAEIKRDIRDVVRAGIHKQLEEKFTVVDTGRIGKHMTACQIVHDFSDVRSIPESVQIFDTISSELKKIASCFQDSPSG